VANTDSLLDDESRKSIMLLKGIKGTHLFVPRIGKLGANFYMFSFTKCLKHHHYIILKRCYFSI
jgi:hypothetical protein